MKNIIKKIFPSFVLDFYYYSLSRIGSFIYNFSSEKMIIIGVTGTKGKTSTANFIWSTLMAGGQKTGIITTANIRIGNKEILNKYHMTMPGRFIIQKLMSDMVKVKCKYCIIETTSEGIKQYRNIGINYDIVVFTNLFPEHLPSHGGNFENYKQTKGKLFANLSKSKRKIIDGRKIEKVIIINKDSEHADYFLNFNADKKITFSIKENNSNYKVSNIESTKSGVIFEVKNQSYKINILGKFNVENTLPAIIISDIFNLKIEEIKKGLENLKKIPGRMEIIDQGQNFTLIVDYAHEKESMTNLLKTANSIKKPGSKIIILLGAEGGGRDKAKRPIMGKLAAEMADFVIVSNVDPYEDEPKDILEDIATVCEKFGKVREKNLFVIEDRKTGIKKALILANKDDIVLITGKGAEQSMILKGRSIPWDDRVIVKEILSSLKR